MKKRIVVVLIITILFNFIIPQLTVFADDVTETDRKNFKEVSEEGYDKEKFDKLKDESQITLPSGSTKRVAPGLNSGSAVVTILIGFASLIPLTVNSIMSFAVLSSGGTTESAFWVTIKDICFNDVKVFDINFFNPPRSNLAIELQKNVATWYNAIRTFATVALLCVLIYIAIRMVLSTLASDKAKYKKMLIDWVTSFVLLFVLHYIILIALTVSEVLIEFIRPFGDGISTNIGISMSETLFNEMGTGVGFPLIVPFISACMLTFITLRFFLLYFKRMLTVAFLIVIAPLICVTYSIDKVSDKKAQAFSTWFKELMINIFIQPLHAILYVIFVISASAIAEKVPIFAIVFFMGISRAEKVVKDLFNMRKQGTINSMSEYLKLGGGK